MNQSAYVTVTCRIVREHPFKWQHVFPAEMNPTKSSLNYICSNLSKIGEPYSECLRRFNKSRESLVFAGINCRPCASQLLLVPPSDLKCAHAQPLVSTFSYPLAVIMMDIDHFKQINDTYGHPGGDEVLKSLGEIFRMGAREGDIACRYGGGEFVIVLPRMGIKAALLRAEKWRTEVDAILVRHGDLDIRFTISAGVSAYPDHAIDHESLIECADRARYKAKKDGRNRVTRFESPAESS